MNARILGLLLLPLVAIGCNRSTANRSFDQEFQLTIRAGRGELTDEEKSQLLRENHPILAQVGEPQLRPLMEIFARLPQNLHAQLLEESYVKWKVQELPQETRDVVTEVLDYTIRIRMGLPTFDGKKIGPEIKLDLDDVEVGFAVVELPRTKQKVVSWYALGGELPAPVWITIVNAPASSAQEYVQSHMMRLPLLRPMKSSSPPAELSGDRVTYVASSDLTFALCSTKG